ncbi:MAG: PadR family transcriptional regulator [Chloroflexota bacterium]|nr:PadR family transcriptional regulator [Chloroflexota bacterium]
MSVISTLGYALLSLLARESVSGYDIARQMRAPIGYFWHASHSQIYPELARLQRDGYVRHEVVEQHDRPDKKVYSLTDAGREALRAWVTSPLDVPSVRDELVLRAYSLWIADRGAAAALFREHERRHLAQLAQYQAIEAHLKGMSPQLPPITAQGFAAYATLQRGIGYEREYAAWCQWVAEQLEGAPTT